MTQPPVARRYKQHARTLMNNHTNPLKSTTGKGKTVQCEWSWLSITTERADQKRNARRKGSRKGSVFVLLAFGSSWEAFGEESPESLVFRKEAVMCLLNKRRQHRRVPKAVSQFTWVLSHLDPESICRMRLFTNRPHNEESMPIDKDGRTPRMHVGGQGSADFGYSRCNP